jgi:hypothetical protein
MGFGTLGFVFLLISLISLALSIQHWAFWEASTHFSKVGNVANQLSKALKLNHPKNLFSQIDFRSYGALDS